MRLTIKTVLLTGTATAILFFATQAQAATTIVSGSGTIAGGTGTDAPDAVTPATPGVQFVGALPGTSVSNTGNVMGGRGFDATVSGDDGTAGGIGIDFNGDSGTSDARAD